ncbi:MAG TPA: hypothetical protein VMT50_06465 [Steroidobacteraceae bacterium]|nr:hypothetical protein [Steroidobacteraceae bacterium]
MVMLCLLWSGSGCAVDCKSPQNAASAECTVLGDLVDCAKALEPAVVTAAKADLEAAIGGADLGALPAAVEAQLEDLAVKYGGCVIAQVFAGYIAPGSLVVSGGVHFTAAAARTEFAVLRNRLWPGRSFKTPGGTL